MAEDADPFRTVGLVIGSLVVVFLAVLLAVPFVGGPEAALTLPLVVVIPAVLAVLYWYLRDV